jgi:hypothetical protein
MRIEINGAAGIDLSKYSTTSACGAERKTGRQG